MKYTLVTGAFGVLGSEIVKKLVQQDIKVIALVRSTSDSSRLTKEILNKIIVFKSDTQELRELFITYSIKCIVHTATLYGASDNMSNLIKNNVLFPIELVELAVANNVEAFINTDSYFNKFNNYSYLGNYITTKRHLEVWLKKIEGIKVFNLKLEHIYTENDTNRKFVNSILNKLRDKSDAIELTEGFQKRDFIYISDVVDFYMTLIKNYEQIKMGFHSYEVGTGKSTSIRDFAITSKNIFRNKKTALLFGQIPTRDNEINESKADLSKIPSILQWSPKVSLEEGLKIIKDKWNS